MTVTINGSGSITEEITIDGVKVGQGGGNVTTNTAVGVSALAANEAGGTNNTAIGYQALDANTTGDQNTAVGDSALGANSTASNNTAVGYQALTANTTGKDSVAVGRGAGVTQTTAIANCFIGVGAGGGVTTGSYNTFIGSGEVGVTAGAGEFMTTGSKNTILGRYSGNQGSLDIRTLSNYIVLSDGDGNPRGYWTNDGSLISRRRIVSSGPSGFGVFHGPSVTLAASSSIQISGGSAAQLICVANGNSGEGGVFFANFNVTVSQIAGSGSGISTSDSGSAAITVYKNSSSNDVYVKNRSAGSATLYITMFCGENGNLA